MCLLLVNQVHKCVFYLSVWTIKLQTEDTLRSGFEISIHLRTIVALYLTFRDQNACLIDTLPILLINRMDILSMVEKGLISN